MEPSAARGVSVGAEEALARPDDSGIACVCLCRLIVRARLKVGGGDACLTKRPGARDSESE